MLLHQTPPSLTRQYRWSVTRFYFVPVSTFGHAIRLTDLKSKDFYSATAYSPKWLLTSCPFRELSPFSSRPLPPGGGPVSIEPWSLGEFPFAKLTRWSTTPISCQFVVMTFRKLARMLRSLVRRIVSRKMVEFVCMYSKANNHHCD